MIANDVLKVFGIAGAAAGGFVGVGGSVLVLNVKSVTDAGVADWATLDAGGAVTVAASMDEHSTPIGFAAGIGAVGVAAQVAVVNDSGTQNAHIDDNAAVVRAGGGLTVKVNATRDVHAYAIGLAFGAGAIGAAVAYVSVDGDASATIGNVAVGATSAIGGLTVQAVDSVNPDTYAIAVAGGLGLGFGAVGRGDQPRRHAQGRVRGARDGGRRGQHHRRRHAPQQPAHASTSRPASSRSASPST